MSLLPSEIARLILGYLEEEKLFETYTSFLNECKHLDECKQCINEGIEFRKTIDGKTLKQFLSTKKGHKSLNQAECVDEKSKKNSLVMDKVILKVPKLNSTKPLKRKLSIIKIKSNDNLENQQQVDDLLNIDLDSFIQNLCKNDFAEKLAESINQVKTKSDLNRSKESIEQTHEEKQEEQQDMEQIDLNNDLQQFDIDLNDISILAESFSQPACDALIQSANNLDEFFVDLASIEGIIEPLNEVKEAPKSEYKRAKTISQLVQETQEMSSKTRTTNPVMEELYKSCKIINDNSIKNILESNQLSKRSQNKCRSKFKQQKILHSKK